VSLRPGTTTSIDFVEEYARAAERFAAAVGHSELRSPVPGCPVWSTYDVVVHLGNVHAWAATIVETGAATAEQNDAPGSRKPRVVSDWYTGKAEDLYQVLRAADPDAACWNFAGVALTARFWPRRQTHETLMHLHDVDQAHGRTTDLAAPVSANGVAEVLEVFLPRMHARGHPVALTRPLTLYATDTGDAWTLLPQQDAPPVVRTAGFGTDGSVPAGLEGNDLGSGGQGSDGSNGAGSVTHGGEAHDSVNGTAAELWRLLWNRSRPPGSPNVAAQRGAAPRLPAAEVSYRGDADRIAAFVGSRLTP